VIPNDMECHINSTHTTYDDADEYDYPSIGQINHVVVKSGVYVIFAVVQGDNEASKSVLSQYQDLSKSVQYSEVAVLKADSSDVVQKIRDVYKVITALSF
jgi:hypothetical protein